MSEEDDLLNPDLSSRDFKTRLEQRFEEEFHDEISEEKLDEIDQQEVFSFLVKFRKNFIQPEWGEILVTSLKQNPSTSDLKDQMLRTTFEGFESRPHMLVIESFQRITGEAPSLQSNYGFL